MNFHASAINIIKNCSTYSRDRKELKKYGLNNYSNLLNIINGFYNFKINSVTITS